MGRTFSRINGEDTIKGGNMKAIVMQKHGPPEVLRLQEVPKPKPADNEVLIRVHAATVTQGDVMLRKLHPLLYLPMRLFGIKRKRIPGHEFAGVIEEIGKGCKTIQARRPGLWNDHRVEGRRQCRVCLFARKMEKGRTGNNANERDL